MGATVGCLVTNDGLFVTNNFGGVWLVKCFNIAEGGLANGSLCCVDDGSICDLVGECVGGTLPLVHCIVSGSGMDGCCSFVHSGLVGDLLVIEGSSLVDTVNFFVFDDSAEII